MKKKLLIVDDDEVMVLLLKKLFEKNYQVFTADDGVEAMGCLSQGIMPDLIISDIVMENITGREFIKHLLTSTLYKNIPVIIVSGAPTAELVKDFPSIEIVHKPFDPIVLKKSVEKAITKLANLEISCNN